VQWTYFGRVPLTTEIQANIDNMVAQATEEDDD
jgi:hypothetical protein